MNSLRESSRAIRTWAEGPTVVKTWKEGTEFWLTKPTGEVKRDRYRITFLSDHDGIVPMQPCVEVRREKSSQVSASAFHRDPNALLSEEYGIVGKLLERELQQAKHAQNNPIRYEAEKRGTAKRRKHDGYLPWFFKLQKPMYSFFGTIMHCGNLGVMFQTPLIRRSTSRARFGDDPRCR